jgi:hypothetical protein
MSTFTLTADYIASKSEHAEREAAVEQTMRSTIAKLLPTIGRKKNLPQVTQTHGEWAGVATLARSRNYVLPPRPAGIRKISKGAKR